MILLQYIVIIRIKVRLQNLKGEFFRFNMDIDFLYLIRNLYFLCNYFDFDNVYNFEIYDRLKFEGIEFFLISD